MRKLLPLLLLLLLLPLTALAKTDMTLTPGEMGFEYDITGDPWIVLTWDSKSDDGRITLYAEDGHHTGRVDLPFGAAGGKYTVTVLDMKQYKAATKAIQVPKAADYTAPSGKSAGNVKNFTLTATDTGFKYSFVAEGTDYMLLYFRSKQQNATFPVYPVDESGLYEGEVVADLTYARTLFTVQVKTGKGTVKKEDTVRMGYAFPDAPEVQEGRLSGVIVCIDPGHQENGQYVTEPNGPGLPGTSKTKGGMAQGKVTLRKEDIVVLEVGMKLRDLLIREGATVVMTRTKQDEFHTNVERAEIANEAGAHIMLRLHCNYSSSNTSKSGIQIYCPVNSDYARAVADAAEYRALAESFLDEVKVAAGYELTDKTGTVRLNDTYVGSNWAKMLCFLVEMGYMSNPAEDVKLADAKYQEMLAQGMIEGIYQVALQRGWVDAE